MSAQSRINVSAVLKTVVRVWAALTEGALLPPIGVNMLLQLVPSNQNFSIKPIKRYIFFKNNFLHILKLVYCKDIVNKEGPVLCILSWLLSFPQVVLTL